MFSLDSSEEKEWGISEKIPATFTRLIREYVAEKIRQRITYHQIAADLGVRPAVLSRWLAGMGPLREKDIRKLSTIFGLSIYITCGLKLPDQKKAVDR